MLHKFWTILSTAALAIFLGTTSLTYSAYAQGKQEIYKSSEDLNQVELSDKTEETQVDSNAEEPEFDSKEDSSLDKSYKKRRRRSRHHSYRGGGGMASWYGAGGGYTAAHPNLPFGTRVRVTNLRTNRSVVVTINDRGPFIGGRVIDVSTAAARDLGMIDSGVAPVSLQVVDR